MKESFLVKFSYSKLISLRRQIKNCKYAVKTVKWGRVVPKSMISDFRSNFFKISDFLLL